MRDPESRPRPHVLVADGRATFRDGLARLLESTCGVAVAALAADAAEAARLAWTHAIDLAIIAHDLPGGAIAAGSAVIAARPQARFLVYAAQPSPAQARALIAAGAAGVADVAEGSAALLKLIAATDRVGAPPGKPAAGALTAREREIVALLAQGHTNARIAALTGLSEHTVRAHLRNIARKLGARNRAQTVTTAIQSGQIAPRGPA
jgi:two-component system nitrate/nitrite response regulator NarL